MLLRRLRRNIDKQLSNIIAGSLDLSLAVTIVHDEIWEALKYPSVYSGLKFQQATNWGDWLAINPYMPTGNPNPDNIINNGETPEEGGNEEGGEGEEGGDENEENCYWWLQRL